MEYGGGVDPILLDEVECSGTERNLLVCDHSDIGDHDCVDIEAVGVRCDCMFKRTGIIHNY